MNVFIQFVSFEQGKELFDLFEVPRCLLGENLRKETYSWIGLDGRKASVDSLSKLYSKVESVKFAQIGYETELKSIGRVGPRKLVFGRRFHPALSAQKGVSP